MSVPVDVLQQGLYRSKFKGKCLEKKNAKCAVVLFGVCLENL